MSRIVLAFRSFFAILFSGKLPVDLATSFGLVDKASIPTPKPLPEFKPSDGALQLLGILQRDARLIDFFMEDISPYSDDQVGAVVRNLHEQSRKALDRYVKFLPVIDGVEGTYAKVETNDPGLVKLIGNVPATGKAAGGTLRHKGWRAEQLNLPALAAKQKTDIVAPAEIEIE